VEFGCQISVCQGTKKTMKTSVELAGRRTLRMHKNLVPTSKKTRCISITKIDCFNAASGNNRCLF
jgi:hypothetical protein